MKAKAVNVSVLLSKKNESEAARLTYQAIKQIIDKGNDVEIKKTKGGFRIVEENKKTAIEFELRP